MSQNNKGAYGPLLIVAIGATVAILAVYGLLGLFGPGTEGRGGDSNFDSVVLDSSLTAGSYVSAGTILYTGGTSGLGMQVSAGSCNSATSTIFAVANPFSATSSAELIYLKGVGNATTTDLKVGTSTRTTGLTSAGTNATLATVQISTTTSFYIASGALYGPNNNITASGTTTSKVIVGPGETIGAFATTTATGAGAAQYSGGYTSCTYKVLWWN